MLQRLAWFQLRCTMLLLSLHLGVLGAGLLNHHAETRRYERRVVAARDRGHFWRAVAGQEPAVNPRALDHLANDLRARLGPVDPEATALPAALRRFRGDANAYGGVSRDLGYDPFEEAGLGCQECGPLDARTRLSLLQLKRGRLADVLAADRPTPAGHAHLTPFGIGVAETILLDLLAGGGFLLLVFGALGRPRLEWRGALPPLENGARLALTLQAPLVVIPWRTLRRVQDRALVARGLARDPEIALAVEQVDEQLARVHPSHAWDPAVVALQRARDELVGQVRELTRKTDHERESDDVARTLLGADDKLREARELVELRQRAVKELTQRG